jgi:hypothetical protein
VRTRPWLKVRVTVNLPLLLPIGVSSYRRGFVGEPLVDGVCKTACWIGSAGRSCVRCLWQGLLRIPVAAGLNCNTFALLVCEGEELERCLTRPVTPGDVAGAGVSNFQRSLQGLLLLNTGWHRSHHSVFCFPSHCWAQRHFVVPVGHSANPYSVF